MTTEEKLKNFYDFSMESAKSEGESILHDYQASLDRIFADHQAMKRSQAEMTLREETEKLHRDSNKTLSDEQIKIRRTLSEKQNEVKDALFVEVTEKLKAFKTKPEYTEYLIRKIKEARDFAGSDPMVVYIDPSDASLADKISAAAGIGVTISKTPFTGGMRAVIESKHILIDNSFDTLMSEAKAKFSID
jgi:vacuolar-type H+-ATPase subunit E/Vma4